VPAAATLVGLALLLALVRTARTARTLAAGIPLLAGLVAVAVAGGSVLPFAARPYDVRELVSPPPPKPLSGVSPLDQVSAWLQNPYRQLFTVRSPTESNWRLAVLDRFDGVTWTSGAGYLPTGGRVPALATGAARDARAVVEQEFTLQKLPGPWLPAADRPERVTGKGLMVDPATGVLASTAPDREGATYRVTSGVRRFTATELREAVPANDPAALALPAGPDGGTPPQRAVFGSIARKATAGATSPMQQAVRLATYLRKLADYDVNSPPGHSYRSIQFFLTEARKGTTEQFAASFALLARSLGLPSRVVVGFGPGKSRGGVRQVLAGDVLAWSEVEFKGIGWVPFYPTPARSHAGRSGDVAEGVSKEQQEIEQAVSTDTAKPAPSPSKPAPAPKAAGSGKGVAWLPIAGLAAAVLLGGYLLGVLVLPPLRRLRRRRAADPRARVSGAWLQTLVRLRAAGVPAATGLLTAGEVASMGVAALGSHAYEPLTALANLANHTRFGDGVVDTTAADTAWRHFAGIDALVRRKVAAPRRALRRLAPSSLLH
jgi:transglutaminase-like putative cysteine protease